MPAHPTAAALREAAGSRGKRRPPARMYRVKHARRARDRTRFAVPALHIRATKRSTRAPKAAYGATDNHARDLVDSTMRYPGAYIVGA